MLMPVEFIFTNTNKKRLPEKINPAKGRSKHFSFCPFHLFHKR